MVQEKKARKKKSDKLLTVLILSAQLLTRNCGLIKETMAVLNQQKLDIKKKKKHKETLDILS